MSSVKDKVQLEIRKLRKKLRQIENLETCDRALTEEEHEKVYKKYDIRSHLLELLATQSEPADEKSVLDINLSLNSTSESAKDQDVIYDNTHNEGIESDSLEENEEVMQASAHENVTDDAKQGDTQKDTAPESLPPVDKGSGDFVLAETAVSNTKRDVHPESSHAKTEVTSTVSEKKSLPAKSSDDPDHSFIYHLLSMYDELVVNSLSSLQRGVHVEGEGANLFSVQEGVKYAKHGTRTDKSKGKPKTSKAKRKREFIVYEMTGHNDIVCSVCIKCAKILSGSRDTTVKLWDGRDGVEIRSMGGHTDTVTSVLMLTDVDAHILGKCLDAADAVKLIGVSGSRDCSLRFWDLDTGECIKSIYTYNAINCLEFLTCSQQAYIVVGTDGGKIELWDVNSQTVHASVHADEEAITGVKVEAGLIHTCSSSGLVKIYQLRSEETLHLMYESESLKLASGAVLPHKPVRCLDVTSQRVFYGDDGMSLKVLDWKSGFVSKLSHHSGDYGFTDSVCCISDHLALASGYDLDNGIGYINAWSLPVEKYSFTVCDETTGRITCLHASQSHDGLISMVTGGVQLKLWRERASQSSKSLCDDDVISGQYVPQFDRVPRSSDVESESEVTESENDDAPSDPPLPWQHNETVPEAKSWLSWCTVL